MARMNRAEANPAAGPLRDRDWGKYTERVSAAFFAAFSAGLTAPQVFEYKRNFRPFHYFTPLFLPLSCRFFFVTPSGSPPAVVAYLKRAMGDGHFE